MRVHTILAALLVLCPAVANAELYKLAVPGDSGIQLYWWPVMPIPEGWVHSEEISRSSGVNMLLPVGRTFSDAPAVIYGRADFKPRIADVKSLSEYIAKDRNALASESPTTVIAELPPAKTGDGKPVTVLSYTIPSRHQWELTAYAEEGEFYLLFTVSASSEAGLKESRSAFYGILASYKERP